MPLSYPNKFAWFIAVLAIVGLALVVGRLFSVNSTEAISKATISKAESPQFLGSARCAECHAAEHAAWQDSQHARAMQHATAATVLGDFADTRFSYGGVTSRFFRRDARFFVRTDGPDGQLADFEIKYTFGVEPLQQYLIELPRGRLQALSIAWDTRPRSAGGQRWFHLYPEDPDPAERIDHRDALHWTKSAQNWNFMCADCHSTNVRKGYEATSDTFNTTWSDLAVGCEACHGPGSGHVAAPALPYQRIVEGHVAAEMAACAACHSRRAQYAEGALAGDPLMDHYLPAVLAEELYHPDGQQQGEVFVWGSYIQSRKHAAGVTCGACHEPHTQKLRVPGNAVCTQCHTAATFDVPEHHRHAPGSAAAECVSCHMRENTYMVIDPRRDHGFHVPRPDLSAKLGTPNACADCHADRDTRWAAAALARWHGSAGGERPHFAEALAAGRRGTAGAVSQLRAVIDDRTQPPMVRASALDLLARYPGDLAADTIRRSLSDPDPQVRYQALRGLPPAPPAQLARWLSPSLEDAARANRHEAARQLAQARVDLPASAAAKLSAELADLERTLRHDLSRGEAWANLANLQADRGDLAAAEASLRSAIRLESSFIPAWANLADLLRSAGRETEVESLLREALARNPGAPALHESLGLSLVRQGRKAAALREFAAAHAAAPEIPRFRYVYALALQDAGRAGEARRLLAQGLELRFDRDLALALAAFAREAGEFDTSDKILAQWRAVNPGDPALRNVAE
jgi:predicted CXXCH cytochrome family protein